MSLSDERLQLNKRRAGPRERALPSGRPPQGQRPPAPPRAGGGTHSSGAFSRCGPERRRVLGRNPKKSILSQETEKAHVCNFLRCELLFLNIAILKHT